VVDQLAQSRASQQLRLFFKANSSSILRRPICWNSSASLACLLLLGVAALASGLTARWRPPASCFFHWLTWIGDRVISGGQFSWSVLRPTDRLHGDPGFELRAVVRRLLNSFGEGSPTVGAPFRGGPRLKVNRWAWSRKPDQLLVCLASSPCVRTDSAKLGYCFNSLPSPRR